MDPIYKEDTVPAELVEVRRTWSKPTVHTAEVSVVTERATDIGHFDGGGGEFYSS